MRNVCVILFNLIVLREQHFNFFVFFFLAPSFQLIPRKYKGSNLGGFYGKSEKSDDQLRTLHRTPGLRLGKGTCATRTIGQHAKCIILFNLIYFIKRIRLFKKIKLIIYLLFNYQ